MRQVKDKALKGKTNLEKLIMKLDFYLEICKASNLKEAERTFVLGALSGLLAFDKVLGKKYKAAFLRRAK